jgi:hypothetical protein
MSQLLGRKWNSEKGIATDTHNSQPRLEMARTFGDHGARVTLAHMAQAWLRVADNCQDAKKVPRAMQQQQQIQPKDDSKKA